MAGEISKDKNPGREAVRAGVKRINFMKEDISCRD